MSLNNQTQRIICCVLAVMIAVGALCGLVYGAVTSDADEQRKPSGQASTSEIFSGRHTQYHETTEVVESVYTTEGFKLRLESDTLQVWVKEKTAMVRIVDRRSGYVWGLSADEKPSNLNKSWYAMASSLCAIEYYDEKDAEKRASTESNKVDLDFDWAKDHFLCHIDMKELGIRLTVKVLLDGESVLCSVEDGSIEEYGECKLKSLYFMPFLGSTYADEVDGYFFVPDGCGALIRFQKPSAYNSAFEGRIYGADPSVDAVAVPGNLLASRGNDYLVAENALTLPVYGIVHGEGQNGVFAIVKDGVEQAHITANPAGLITDYNWISAYFAYRVSYMKPVNKAGAGVYTAQETMNDISPAVEFVFLTGDDADYSSMAVYYRDRLIEEGVLTTNAAQEQIPLWLSILGAEIKEGVLFNTTEVLTTIDDAQSITQTLQNTGIRNLLVSYYGWQRGGVNGSKYGEMRLDGRLGNTSDLYAWADALSAAGGRLNLYSNLGQANEEQITLRLHAAQNMSSTYTHYTVDNKTLMYPDSYVLQLAEMIDNYNKMVQKWPGLSVALDNIGHNPASSYEKGNSYTRKEAMEALTELLKASAEPVALFQPAAYQWQYVSDYLDMPMSSSQYLFETDTVPFLHIVLKGCMNYYTPYSNLGFYSDNAVLKMVEFGAYPSYIVAEAQSHELEDTPLENMFSVNFGDWKGSITDVYQYVSSALNAVEGMTITEHQMVADGIARTTYSGDVRIYVNYNNADVSVDGVTVPARGYLVEGGGK